MPGRVLRVVTRLNQGGPWRQLLALAPRLIDRGWEGPVLVGQTEPHEPDGTDSLCATGVDVIRVPGLRRGIDPVDDMRAFNATLREIRRVKPDVVHTHMGKAGALGRLAASAAGVPAVHTLHGHHFARDGATGAAARGAERVLGRVTSALVCLSEQQRIDVVDRHKIVHASRAHVIAPGLETRPFVTGPTRRPECDVHVVWTGRFVDVKDPLAFVDLTRQLPASWRVTMFGEGPLRADVVEAAQAAGLEDRLICPGPVDDVGPWLRGADLFVLPSKSEGMSISAIEAMLAGCPVVVTAVGGMPDLVEDGVTGRIVPAGDGAALAVAVTALGGNPGRAREMGAAARESALQRFEPGRLADETAALYDRVARRRAGDGTIPVPCPTPSIR